MVGDENDTMFVVESELRRNTWKVAPSRSLDSRLLEIKYSAFNIKYSTMMM